MVKRILNSHKSIIFLNGKLPILKEYNYILKNRIKIAADGAANNIINQGNIKLDYVIGDLDSFSDIGHPSIKRVIKVSNQDNTDFEKCMDFIVRKKLFPTLVLGIGGGEIDHAINNIFALSNHQLSDVFFFDINKFSKKLGILLNSKKSLNLTLPINSKISLIPFPNALVTTVGLRWELNKQQLDNSKFISARNYNIFEKIKYIFEN